MFEKNIFKFILIFGSIADRDYLVASDKQDSIFNDFTTNLGNLSYTDISIIGLAASVSMYAGYYAGQTLRKQPDIDDETSVISEASEEVICSFSFNKHAFGKLSEDGSQESLPDLEVIPGHEELDDLYEWTNAMKNQKVDSPKSCRVIPPVRSYHNKSENDEKKFLCQTIKPFLE